MLRRIDWQILKGRSVAWCLSVHNGGRNVLTEILFLCTVHEHMGTSHAAKLTYLVLQLPALDMKFLRHCAHFRGAN
jgi:hypothetical protein